MQIFKDITKTKILESIESLGEIPAGESKLFEYFVFNETDNHYRSLRFLSNNPEIVVRSTFDGLKPKETGKLIVEWKSDISLKQGIKANIEILGEEVCYPRGE